MGNTSPVNELPKPDDRVAIIGKTGTGKTWAGGLLTRHIPRLLVVDSKPSAALQKWGLEQWSFNTTPSPRRFIRRGINGTARDIKLHNRIENGDPFRVIYRPPRGFDYERLWEWAYNMGNVTIFIDELYRTIPDSGRAGEWLRAAYTGGREKGLGMWACMQRPSWVPKFAISEAEWTFLFRLVIPEDVQYMSKLIGPEARQELKGHAVMVYNQEWDKPRTYNRGLIAA